MYPISGRLGSIRIQHGRHSNRRSFFFSSCGGTVAGGKSAVADTVACLKSKSLLRPTAWFWWYGIAVLLRVSQGVAVLGLGTFTLNKVNDTKSIPVFVLSERFANRNNVKVNTPHVEGNTPVSNLNLSWIAGEAELDKGEVDACIREVLMVMTRKLDDPRGIALDFHGIGRLSVKRRKVRFTFFRQFLNNPRPLVGRPPSRSGLSSRCGTAGIFGGGSRPPSRSQSRPSTQRGHTPLLFPERYTCIPSICCNAHMHCLASY